MNINGYELITDFNTANSGFSKWAFAEKNGKEYFIKQHINPVYPLNPEYLMPEIYEAIKSECRKFEEQYSKLYSKINEASRGNLVRIEELFRFESHYYTVMERISNPLNIKQIAALSLREKYLLIKSVAYAFECLHAKNIVHLDVKPANILVKETAKKNYVAKIIDFDAGIFVGEIDSDTEIYGDITYFAPETFQKLSGENIIINTKADIFSMGLIFHEFFCGKLPAIDNEYDYVYEAVLSGATPQVALENVPREMAEIIEKMLYKEPEKRPTAKDIMLLIEKAENESDVLAENHRHNTEKSFKIAGDL